MQGLDSAQAGKCGSVVKHSRKGETPRVKACPVEVAEDPASSIRRGKVTDDRELMRRIFPCAAVKNEAIDPTPEFLIERFGEFRFPPKAKREIGIEVRENNIGKRMGAVPIKSECDLFGANLALAFAREMAVGADPSLGFGYWGEGIRYDQNRAAGVFAGDGRYDLGVGRERVGIFGVNDEIDQRGAGLGVITRLPETTQFFFDFSDFDRDA